MSTKQFYDYKPSELRFIPFDIETTGFKAGEDDIVTTIVAHDEGTYNIWLNTDGNNVSQPELKEQILEKSSSLNSIMLYVSNSESELLASFGEFIQNAPRKGTIFTAFNGETYRGTTDFDMPFLRTRFFTNGLKWPFKGYWYSDSYEVFSQKNRFNTTVTEEPSLDNLKNDEIKRFVDDMDLDIHYSKMNKSEIVNKLHKINELHDITLLLKKWTNKKNIDYVTNFNSLTKKQLQRFIDDMCINISYKKLSKQELIDEIKAQDYEYLLDTWYNKTDRSYGTMNMTTLDGIHEKIVEKNMKNKSWVENLPIELELFKPFDPYEDSSEAVMGFENQEYTNLILHCLADVARTVNITQIMMEYIPQQDYKPKVL